MNSMNLRALLAEPEQSGAYYVDARDTAAMAEAAAALDFGLARVDLAGCTGKDDLLARVGRAARFPDWFGRNWDALADSLGDLSWWPAPGYVLLLEHSSECRAAAAEDFSTLLAILNEAAEDWRERNVAFWALLPLPADELADQHAHAQDEHADERELGPDDVLPRDD